ncbi:hypothetical protein [Seonamhaeicola sp.]|uniref:hypothetical protein n=1 Tax=Seonamhaeicola sp. TaxID=1912245 RepID=UPI0026108462|nr:hypothetical protein [Seonamhaeicola sp.]
MFSSPNSISKTKGLLLICLLVCCALYSQDSYTRLVDSAYNHIDKNSIKASQFLDSIPQPVEKYIEGRLSDYYALKALIHDDNNETPDVYHSSILALKYAEIEKNYKTAGHMCLDLFSTLYFVNQDSTAYAYLNKAEAYYELSEYKNGLLEVEQMKAYAKFLDGDYALCNKLLLEHLEAYRNVKDDAYHYMFALYMITSSYVHLGDFEKAHTYYKKFKVLKDKQMVVLFNHNSFKASIDVVFAEVFFRNKQIDSTLYYLSHATENRRFMGDDTVKSYFTLYSDFYKNSGELEASKKYLDSLKVFEEKMFRNMIDASFQINNALLKTEIELKKESKGKFFLGLFGVILFCVFATVSLLYFIYYRKQKLKLNDLDAQTKNIPYLKSNNEKLTVKVHSLEDYISCLKNEVKIIASIDDVVVQREKIKEFYTALHLNSSTILDEGKNHLELVNDFNIDFFKRMNELYPKLNDSDIIICYYIFIGFKNKEIAVFLNTSVRAIESKRYRITKKIHLDGQDTTLLEFLRNTFEQSYLE